MPFLIGAFGPLVKSSQGKFLIEQAYQYAKPNSLHSINTDNLIAFAGYKNEEKHFSDKIIQLNNTQGFFIGKIFDRKNYQPSIFRASDINELIEDPKLLLKNWWGRYIGMLHNEKTQKCTLARDPQGLYTLFYIIKPNGIIFSSDMSYLYDALEEKPSVNLNYFAEYVINKNHASALTPLHEIQELLPGMGLHIEKNGTTTIEQLWDLSDCKGSFIADEKAFEEELLTTLKSSLKAWTNDSTGICLELSGGLDSSAVMVLIRDILPEDKTLIGVNYFDSKTPSSNEIEHAKEVAEICNVPMLLMDWQDSSLLDPIPESWRPNKPNTFFLFYRSNQQLIDLADKYNCSEIMNGQGGDHIFLAPQPIESLADYWLDKGFRGILNPLKELSSANRMPWWILTRDTIKNIAYYYGKKEKLNNTADTEFLNSSFKYASSRHEFYLKKNLKNFYPAKIKHIESLFHALTYADRNQRILGHTITHPLLSQPIIELGLKIPTYQSFKNGYDRIFFRNSVSHIKKSQAFWRKIKGETSGSMSKAFASNALKVHDILLQGRLVKEGLINKQWLDKQIVKIRHGYIENLWPITHLLVSQLWLNQWKL